MSESDKHKDKKVHEEDDEKKKSKFKSIFNESLRMIGARARKEEEEPVRTQPLSPRTKRPEDAMLSPRARAQSKHVIEPQRDGAISPRRQSQSKQEITRVRPDESGALSPRTKRSQDDSLVDSARKQQTKKEEDKSISEAHSADLESSKNKRLSSSAAPTHSDDEDMTAPSESLKDDDDLSGSESEALCCKCKKDVKNLMKRIVTLEKLISHNHAQGNFALPESTPMTGSMDEMIKLRRCVRPGCGKMFQYIANTNDVCRFHHGQWIDGYPKGYWSCCKKKDRAAVGCTSGVHAG